MNKVEITIILILILLTPGIILVFLNTFGENEFDIPIYYQAEVVNPFSECGPVNQSQFYANDIVDRFDEMDKTHLIIFFEEDSNFSLTQLANVWSRLEALYGNENINMSTFILNDSSQLDGRSYRNPEMLEREEFVKMMHCGALTDTVNQFILIDNKARIRGYYGYDLDEVDKLVAETKILLEQ